MLNLFTGGKADHPMANPKEARRILDELPAQELKALEELSHWHESVSTAAGFKPAERLQLIGALDEAAQPRLRKLARLPRRNAPVALPGKPALDAGARVLARPQL